MANGQRERERERGRGPADAARARLGLAIGTCLAACIGGAPASAADVLPRCEQRSEYQRLRFWLGHWEALEAGKPAGSNTITAVLGGCAIVENWTEPDGSEGKSWFYYEPVSARWKQVWITDQAWQLGGTKEKAEIPANGGRGALPGRAIRARRTAHPRSHDADAERRCHSAAGDRDVLGRGRNVGLAVGRDIPAGAGVASTAAGVAVDGARRGYPSAPPERSVSISAAV